MSNGDLPYELKIPKVDEIAALIREYRMKLGIMQPYFFPYIGYFQLINKVDKFIFYDDVNFIKNGWINRNRILINNAPNYITVQLKKASPFKLINQIQFTDNRPKLLKTVKQVYKKAPNFEDVWPIIEICLTFETHLISELSIKSVMEVCNYLNLSTKFEISSVHYPETKHFERTERILSICKNNRAKVYINAIGGMALYSKDIFEKHGINLYFIQTDEIEYNQLCPVFVPGLSIIDVLMFNSKEQVNSMLCRCELS